MPKAKPKVPKTEKMSVEPLITAGSLLANLAFNGKQDAAVPLRYRTAMRECQSQWDRALREYRNAVKKGGKS